MTTGCCPSISVSTSSLTSYSPPLNLSILPFDGSRLYQTNLVNGHYRYHWIVIDEDLLINLPPFPIYNLIFTYLQEHIHSCVIISFTFLFA